MECRVTIISAVIITAFVYTLVHTHFSSVTRLSRLQGEVEEITKVILGRQPDETLLPQIDKFIKKRTQGLWDELTTVKKKLDLIQGASTAGASCGFADKMATKELQIVNEEEPNFALQTIGASIAHTEEEPLNLGGFLHKICGIKYMSNPPEEILNPSMQLGSCYAFKGDTSSFTIKLSHKIFIRSITVEHIHESMSLTGDISNAPKDFVVYGLNNLNKDQEILLGTFQYNNTISKRAQTFHLDNNQRFKYCKIKVISNYGNVNYTCIYRVAVHGKL